MPGKQACLQYSEHSSSKCKDSASQAKCKIKAAKTDIYFHFRDTPTLDKNRRLNHGKTVTAILPCKSSQDPILIQIFRGYVYFPIVPFKSVCHLELSEQGDVFKRLEYRVTLHYTCEINHLADAIIKFYQNAVTVQILCV